jgi:hypothetical protein
VPVLERRRQAQRHACERPGVVPGAGIAAADGTLEVTDRTVVGGGRGARADVRLLVLAQALDGAQQVVVGQVREGERHPPAEDEQHEREQARGRRAGMEPEGPHKPFRVSAARLPVKRDPPAGGVRQAEAAITTPSAYPPSSYPPCR